MATKAAPAKRGAAKSFEAPKAQATARPEGNSPSGTRTLTRGLDVIDVVAKGDTALQDLATALGLPRSTAHRLAAALVERRYLKFIRGVGYSLGPRLLELGYVAGQQTSLQRVAREYLEALADATGDTVHLGVREGSRALYLDKIPGRRRVEIISRIGELQPLRSTGIGKALILDASESQLREYYQFETSQGSSYNVRISTWLERMRNYARNGYAFDLEENEDQIRCVAAPIRDVTGRIVAAISLSSAAQYMSDTRMNGLVPDVQETANDISSALGYAGQQPEPPQRKPGGVKKPRR
ncbi:MAG: IclR family transcriptional regulator [Proteobacteria bacterium]|nr:IclR family transcriptional regulator [Pseudomonadota bacterium]